MTGEVKMSRKILFVIIIATVILMAVTFVRAAGNKHYKAGTKAVTVTIKVR